MPFSVLRNEVRTLIAERGFVATDVQTKAVPRIHSGRNVLAIAETGTGKTEAALLPLFSLLLEKPSKGIQLIYITPLRALNRNLIDRIMWWTEKLGITADVRHGDTPQSQRTKQLKNPPQVLVTTPETLCSILSAPKMGEHLNTVKHVVIDEVHELCESKRGSQLSLVMERLAERAGEFQRVALSATVGDPEKVASFVFGARPHEVVKADLGRKLELSVEYPHTSKSDERLAVRLHTPVKVMGRLRRLKELVDKYDSVLTFVNTRSAAEMLSSRFAAWEETQHIGVHHSSLSKDVRVVAEEKFKEGKLKGIIATSSLELGIDIGKIEAVAQYSSPRQVSRLIQRVGRSGHSVGKTPRGFVLANDPEDIIEAGVICKAARHGKLEEPILYEKPLDVLAQQVVGICLDSDRIPIAEVLRIVRKAYPYRDLTLDQLMLVINQLVTEHIIWHEEGFIGKKKWSRLYYYTNLSTIPDEKKYFVKDVTSGKNIGVLDEGFVANNLAAHTVFITKGQPWNVLDITETEVLVEPKGDISAAIPAWEGENIPVPYEIAQDVPVLISSLASGADVGEYCLDDDAIARSKKFAAEQVACFKPHSNEIWIEQIDNFLVLHAFFGNQINETLSKLLAALLSSDLGQSVGITSDAYRIVFEFIDESDINRVKRFLLETNPDEAQKILETTLVRSGLFKHRFIHVAKRFGLISRDADYQKISVRRIISAVLDSPVYAETLNEIFTEKLDLKGMKRVLGEIQSGKIKFHEYRGKEITPLGKQVISKVLRLPEVISPIRPESELVELLQKQLYPKDVKLFCTYCNNVMYDKIENLPDMIKCTKCGSPMVAYIKYETKSRDMLNKVKAKKRLTEDEKKQWKEYMQTATLVNAYGKRAVLVLCGKGVGPEMATRILGRMRRTEKEVLRDMLEAQRNWYQTKRYWT